MSSIFQQKGMSLIEILISITILAFLSTFTAESISNAIRNKKKYEKDMENIASVRDTLRIIEKDIQRAFHYQNIHVELYNEARKKQSELSKKPNQPTPATPNQPGDTPPPPVDPLTPPTPTGPTFTPKEQTLFTQFIGTEKQLNFASLNNSQSAANQPVSDQMEVGYFLKSCKPIFEKSDPTNCLWRRVSSILDDDVITGGQQSALIENVTDFTIKYYSKEKDEWFKTWDSKDSLDPKIKNHFPDAVEVHLQISAPHGGKQKNYEYTLFAKLRFPDNQTTTEDPLSATTSTINNGGGAN